ncbi:MAG: SDR family NAD(P)-dependent oxidoreductase [Solirubrobacteraceae bacterium]|nr:SDR family NAD(P)-dependent oxidoreductase [Solirubrobacteraceae bacterium]
MSRVLITGSADGLGLLAARQILDSGNHEVVLHARSEARATDALAAEPRASSVLVGDLASLEQTRALADQASEAGPFDAVIHNAGVYIVPERTETQDGLPNVFQINVLAPFLLTALMPRPRRLVYLTSGLSLGGEPNLEDLRWTQRRWSADAAYADSKLMDAALASAVARRWPTVSSNSVDPGWVPTKMGGAGATGDLALGADTQAWLAIDPSPEATESGRYLHHREARDPHPAAADPAFQDRLLETCAELTGVALPQD